MSKAFKIAGGIAVGTAVLLAVLVASVWEPDVSVNSLKARWAKPPSQFVALDGMMVHVRDEGPRDDPAPLVLLHGVGSSLQTWDGWAARLKATRRVISIDRPGFGLTGPQPAGNYSMVYNVAFLERLLTRLGVTGPVTLVGNSNGGFMAWRFAGAHPDRVARLVLIAPGGLPRSSPLPSSLAAAMNPRMDFITQHILPKSQIRAGAAISYGNGSRLTDEVVERYYDLTRRQGNRAALGAVLRASITEADPTGLDKVSVPTLILWGTKDQIIPAVPDAEIFHRRIADSTLVMLPGIGHVAQEEDPAGTVAAFENWSAELTH